MRIPKHIGIIPDGNRRWAVNKGLRREDGYEKGLNPGLEFFALCKALGVQELTYYGFTTDNTKRPASQIDAFSKACIDAVKILENQDASLLVIGDTRSPSFPEELIPYTTRRTLGQGDIKVNFLVNYGWHWDVSHLYDSNKGNPIDHLHSKDISRVDLIIRWGGRRRLSGFLPIQSVYSDFYVVDDYWPDFKPQHLYDALNWYEQQDITLGG